MESKFVEIEVLRPNAEEHRAERSRATQRRTWLAREIRAIASVLPEPVLRDRFTALIADMTTGDPDAIEVVEEWTGMSRTALWDRADYR